jgi:hypothetical protein
VRDTVSGVDNASELRAGNACYPAEAGRGAVNRRMGLQDGPINNGPGRKIETSLGPYVSRTERLSVRRRLRILGLDAGRLSLEDVAREANCSRSVAFQVVSAGRRGVRACVTCAKGSDASGPIMCSVDSRPKAMDAKCDSWKSDEETCGRCGSARQVSGGHMVCDDTGRLVSANGSCGDWWAA